MTEGLRILKHLLPNARAWRLTVEKTLRQFFEGLAGLPEDVRDFYDQIFNDIDPQLTRELSAWEVQFALAASALTEQERRDRLAAAWQATGGQSPRYIQDTLQAAGFDVFVHEWWVPSVEHPTGGSVDGDVTPVLRNPLTFLDDGVSGQQFLMTDGSESAQDGDAVAQDGSTATPLGYPLVNKIKVSFVGDAQDGAELMQDGDPEAQDSAVAGSTLRQYIIPDDVTKWPFFLYIGGVTFPDQALVPTSRRDEFENLCLKICPTEQWLGILVTYT